MKSQENLQAYLIMEKHQLGQLVATYRGEWRPAVKLSLGGGLIVALLIAAVLGWGMILGGSQTPGEAATLGTSITGLVFLALVVLFVRIWFQTISLRYVLLCAEGFVSVQGHKVQAVRWDEVETFYRGAGQATFNEGQWYVLRREVLPLPPPAFSLRTKQGAIFHFNRTFLNLAQAGSFTDLSERFHAEKQLADRMEQEISNRLWEKAVAAYQKGLPVTFDPDRRITRRLRAAHQKRLPVTFGKLQISAQGVRKGRKMRSWDEIDSLALEDDEGVIREFRRPEPSPDTPEEAGVSLPPSDLETHLAVTYWQEEVGPLALIIFQMKEECRDEHTLNRGWYASEVPNALVFVALIAYALHQH